MERRFYRQKKALTDGKKAWPPVKGRYRREVSFPDGKTIILPGK
jgi:hypothetical protein